MVQRFIIALWTVMAVLAFGCIAFGAPPPGVSENGPIARWVRNWHDQTGFPCCGISSDCRPTKIRRLNDGGYEAWIGKEQYGDDAPDAWRQIPASAFTHVPPPSVPYSTTSDDNPSGTGWACWYQGRVVCAALGTGM